MHHHPIRQIRELPARSFPRGYGLLQQGQALPLKIRLKNRMLHDQPRRLTAISSD